MNKNARHRDRESRDKLTRVILTNCISLNNQLPGLYHPIAVVLIKILDKKLHGYSFQTGPEWGKSAIPYFSITQRWCGHLIAVVGFSGSEILIILQDNPTGIWDKESSNLCFDIADPDSDFVGISDRIVFAIEACAEAWVTVLGVL